MLERKIDDIEFGIILPKYDNSGRKIDPKFHEEIAEEMSKNFGGVTVIPTILGCWVGENGKLQCEENVLMFSIRDTESIEKGKNINEVINEDRKFMWELGKKAGKIFGQASIMELQGKTEATFIEGKYEKKLKKSKLFIPKVDRNIFEKLI